MNSGLVGTPMVSDGCSDPAYVEGVGAHGLAHIREKV